MFVYYFYNLFKMDSGDESEVEVSSRNGEGEFNVFRIFSKNCCIVWHSFGHPLLNTIKQHATMCNKCCMMFYETLYSFGRGFKSLFHLLCFTMNET